MLGRHSDREVVLTREVEAALRRLNPGLPEDAYVQALALVAMDDATTFAQGDRKSGGEKDKVTAEIAKAHAESEFEKYRLVQDRLVESDFDRLVKQIEWPKNSLQPR